MVRSFQYIEVEQLSLSPFCIKKPEFHIKLLIRLLLTGKFFGHHSPWSLPTKILRRWVPARVPSLNSLNMVSRNKLIPCIEEKVSNFGEIALSFCSSGFSIATIVYGRLIHETWILAYFAPKSRKKFSFSNGLTVRAFRHL